MGIAESTPVVAFVCFMAAVVVRLWAGIVQRKNTLEIDGILQVESAVYQTMGNKELQADRVQVYQNRAGVLAVVADGIGKSNTGQVCAQVATDTLIDRYEVYSSLSQPDYFFRTAFYEVNRRIQMTLEERKGGVNLGAVFIDNSHLYYALVGNIRIALYRGGELIPLSKGHTLDILAEQAWKDGKISRQQALWSIEEKRQWNYVGMDGFSVIEIEEKPIATKAEDVVVLTTCGVFEELSWSEIEDILVKPATLQQKAEEMMAIIEQKESTQKENGSVVLVKVPKVNKP